MWNPPIFKCWKIKNTVWATFPICNLCLGHPNGARAAVASLAWGGQGATAGSWSCLLSCDWGLPQSSSITQVLSEGHSECGPPWPFPSTCHLASFLGLHFPNRTGWLPAFPCYPLLPKADNLVNLRAGRELWDHLLEILVQEITSPSERVENVDFLASPRSPKSECLGLESTECALLTSSPGQSGVLLKVENGSSSPTLTFWWNKSPREGGDLVGWQESEGGPGFQRQWSWKPLPLWLVCHDSRKIILSKILNALSS